MTWIFKCNIWFLSLWIDSTTHIFFNKLFYTIQFRLDNVVKCYYWNIECIAVFQAANIDLSIAIKQSTDDSSANTLVKCPADISSLVCCVEYKKRILHESVYFDSTLLSKWTSVFVKKKISGEFLRQKPACVYSFIYIIICCCGKSVLFSVPKVEKRTFYDW